MCSYYSSHTAITNEKGASDAHSKSHLALLGIVVDQLGDVGQQLLDLLVGSDVILVGALQGQGQGQGQQ